MDRVTAALAEAASHSATEIARYRKGPPELLYHYTSAEGLFGILRTGRLRGSNYSFMNDRSEFTYGANLIRSVISERLGRSVVGFVRRFYELSLDSSFATAADLYLACFCEKGDLLSQWRGYGSASSRYCIEFAPTGFTGCLEEVSPIHPVVYNVKAQRHLLSYIIDEHTRAATNIRSPELDEELAARRAVECLFHCSTAAHAMFKDTTFAEENEWRAIEFIKDREHMSELEFDLSGGQMKPSLPLLRGNAEERLPVTKVIAGASRNTDQAVKAAQLMLGRFGYSDVVVEPSRVPLSG